MTDYEQQGAWVVMLVPSITNPIDISFDFQSDTPNFPKNDPDKRSPTLRQFHKALWSKSLPDGSLFTLTDDKRYAYLYHCSSAGEFYLSSDTLSASFNRISSIRHVRDQVEAEVLNQLLDVMYSIGNMTIFPGRQIQGKMTINQARGCNRKIGDRIDLTLECIRRHYLGQDSPLSVTFKKYADFFDLFRDFRGYVDFFLFHDLAVDDCSVVKFFLPFSDFKKQSPYPDSVDRFETYLRNATKFIQTRNLRILSYVRENSVEA